jgi:hypothetical protein
MQVAAPKPKAIRRAHPGQGVPMWRASKWPKQRSCVENGEKGLGRDHLYSVAAITNSALKKDNNGHTLCFMGQQWGQQWTHT